VKIRNGINAKDFKNYDTSKIRNNFLVKDLFNEGEVSMTYSHIDRIIIGGVCPGQDDITLEVGEEIAAEYFLERRELGVINIGGGGNIVVDGQKYELNPRDGLYIGMGSEDITFISDNADEPAKFYLNSAPAHKSFPNVKVNIDDAKPQKAGSLEKSNKRTIYKYVHPDVAKSCQLLMGMTLLETNNVWNTMPCHTHERRMEVYFYFDMVEEDVVFHYMGEPKETRHIVVRNEQAVINPSWSIHSGVGTGNYTFIWGMVGENQTFSDMDNISMKTLK